MQSVQDRTEKQLNSLQSDVSTIKENVHRIENTQEEVVLGMLIHIKKQVETKESQIQVLNKRLFNVETKTEQTQQ
ncbi:hypothetical protein ACFFIX_11640 [Metabacillus herbersteinensis]|uniref:Uncharacterized protein n=1 Tax=Metabacillus herbersteinensis TaxID=283816 RepID=A0ABV6GEJ1_9BACI